MAATVEGAVVKGPVAGAQVCAYSLAATGRGAALGCATTGADGRYTLRLDHTGPVLLEASGGSYTDEATGQPGVPLAVPLQAIGRVAAGQPVGIVPTPLTTLALRRARATGPLDWAGYVAAADAVAAAFGLPAGLLQSGRVPDVDAATTDPHGQALRGISRMLERGATLDGLLGNADLVALQAAWQAVATPACQPVQPLPGTGTSSGLLCLSPPTLLPDGTLQGTGGGLPAPLPPTPGPRPPGGTLVITGPGGVTVTGGTAPSPSPTLN